MLDVSSETVRPMAASGQLPAEQIGLRERLRIKVADVEVLLASLPRYEAG